MWNCDVLGFKKPCSKSLTSGVWSSRTNVNLKQQTWWQGPGHVNSWCSREMLKNLNLKVSNVQALETCIYEMQLCKIYISLNGFE